MVFADKADRSQPMSHYKHLTIEEREKLYLMLGQGKSLQAVARELARLSIYSMPGAGPQ